jgi:hypothetical protein
MDDPVDDPLTPSPNVPRIQALNHYSIFVLDMASQLGIDIEGDEADLLWLAEEAANEQLPLEWEEHEGEYEGAMHKYYVNSKTGESVWTHPVVTLYLSKLEDERARRGGGQVTENDDDYDDEFEIEQNKTNEEEIRNNNTVNSNTNLMIDSSEVNNDDNEVKLGSATKSEPDSPSEKLLRGLSGKRPAVLASRSVNGTTSTVAATSTATSRSVATAKLSFNFDDVDDDSSTPTTSPLAYRPSTLASASTKTISTGQWSTVAEAAGEKPPTMKRNTQPIVLTETPKREKTTSLLNESQLPLSAGRSAEEEERWLKAQEMLELVEAAEDKVAVQIIPKMPLSPPPTPPVPRPSVLLQSKSPTVTSPDTFSSATDMAGSEFSPVRNRVRAIEAKVSELESQKRSAEVAKEEAEEQLSRVSKAVQLGTNREADLSKSLLQLQVELQHARETIHEHEITIKRYEKLLEEAKSAVLNEKRKAEDEKRKAEDEKRKAEDEKRKAEDALVISKKLEASLRNDVSLLEKDVITAKTEAETSAKVFDQKMRERIAEVEAQGQLVCKALDAALKTEVQRAAKVTADLEHLSSKNSEETALLSKNLQEKEFALQQAKSEILRLESKFLLDTEVLRAQTDKAVAEAALTAGLASDKKWQKELIDFQDKSTKTIRDIESQRGTMNVTISRLTDDISVAQRKIALSLSEIQALTEANSALSIEVTELKAKAIQAEVNAVNANATLVSTFKQTAFVNEGFPVSMDISAPIAPSMTSTSIWATAKREASATDKRRLTDSKGVGFSSTTSSVLMELGISFPSHSEHVDDFESSTMLNRKHYFTTTSPLPRSAPPSVPPAPVILSAPAPAPLPPPVHMFTPDSKRILSSSSIIGSGRLSLSQLRLASPSLRAKRNMLSARVMR